MALRGIVAEKERQAVCVYVTDNNYSILCAIPLSHPKFLKNAEYVVDFDENSGLNGTSFAQY